MIQGRGLRVNGVQETDPRRQLDFDDALHGRYYLLRKGKKSYHLVARADYVSAKTD